jgi:hypothetical protein
LREQDETNLTHKEYSSSVTCSMSSAQVFASPWLGIPLRFVSSYQARIYVQGLGPARDSRSLGGPGDRFDWLEEVAPKTSRACASLSGLSLLDFLKNRNQRKRRQRKPGLREPE